MQNEVMEKWLATRPPIIRELATKWPPGQYKMAYGAPYGITCPGTIVDVIGYSEDGDVIVAVTPDHMLPEAIEHQKRLLEPQGRELSEIAGLAVRAHVDPQYLIPHKDE